MTKEPTDKPIKGVNEFVKGYVVYPTYRVVDDESDKDKKKKKSLIYLFGRLENGESFLAIKSFKSYFYIKEDDLNIEKQDKEQEEKSKHKKEKLDKALKDFDVIVEKTDFKNFNNEKVIKLTLDIPADSLKLRKYLEEELSIDCYEADIVFYQRFLIDNDIKGNLELKGEYKKGSYVSRIYEEPEIRAGSYEYQPELKILSIDIETDSKAKQIYCISLYTEGLKINKEKDAYKKVLIVSHEKDIGKELHNAISLNSEEELLKKFQELMIEIDPDIIAGWNLIDFDLKIIKEKFDKYNIPFNLGRADWPCKIKINDEFMRDSSADFPGRMVLDGIPLLKISYIKLENYRLDTAAEEFLGEKKLIGQENKGEDIERYYKHDQQKLIDYNLKDSELVYKMLFKTGAINLTIDRSLITGMTLERVKASVASLDSVYLRHAKKNKIVLNTSKFSEKEEAGLGGFVMHSKPGIYDYVVVCDFKSLYPSIINTFNVDPYSFVPKDKRPKGIEKSENAKYDKKKYIVTANGAVFRNQEGIMPQIIKELWKKRDEAKRKKDAQKSYAIKIIMNSFYGAIANPSCRFFNLDVSNAITYTGQEIIKLTAENVKELGYEVIYSDTDSIFVVTGANTLEEANKIGKKVEKYVNDFYGQYIQKEYHHKNYLEIQFEKLFKIFLMPTVRGSEEGAKKRYAGLLVDDSGKEEIKFTGMEFVRGDWTDLSKKFQMALFELIFHKEDVAPFIKKFVSDLKEGKYDNLLVYRKHISKEISEYTKTTPPHVKAARKLNAGQLTSNLIEYVMTSDGPEPVQQIKHKFDYEHYIDKQIKPIADTVLSVYGQNFDDILKNSKQSSLFGY